MLFLRQTHSHACSRGMCLLVRICVGLNARARFARERERESARARARVCVCMREREWTLCDESHQSPRKVLAM